MPARSVSTSGAKDEGGRVGPVAQPANAREPIAKQAPNMIRRADCITLPPMETELISLANSILSAENFESAAGDPSPVYEQRMPGNKVRCRTGEVDGGVDKIFGSGQAA